MRKTRVFQIPYQNFCCSVPHIVFSCRANPFFQIGVNANHNEITLFQRYQDSMCNIGWNETNVLCLLVVDNVNFCYCLWTCSLKPPSQKYVKTCHGWLLSKFQYFIFSPRFAFRLTVYYTLYRKGGYVSC